MAPQAVDAAFWSAPAERPARVAGAEFAALNVGRPARYKGLPELLSAWATSGLGPPGNALELVGEASDEEGAPPPGVHRLGAMEPAALRNYLRRRGRPGDVGHRHPRVP